MEYVREVKITVYIDTNKDTTEKVFDLTDNDSFIDVLEFLRDNGILDRERAVK